MIRNYELERRYFDKMGLQIYSDKLGDITLYACPFCNEGGSLGKKHRFHWKFDTDSGQKSYVNCFNCGFGMDFEFFVHKFSGENEFKNLMKEYSKLNESHNGFFEKMLEDDDLIQSPKTISVGGLYSLENSKIAFDFIKSRKLDKFKDVFLSDKYDNVIIPLYNKQKKIFGYQTRMIVNKQFWFMLEDTNKKFRAWNFYNVDWDKPVYIFESVEDALSSGLENIIAVMGRYVSPFIMNKLKQPIICFDNDKDGFISMCKHILKYDKAKALRYPKDFVYKDMNEYLIKENLEFNDVKNFVLNNISNNDFRLKILAESICR